MRKKTRNAPRRATRRSPKYERVREALRRQIADGHYPPGSRLPPETELPRQLHAGKQTIVRALNELAREGLIVRRRGDGSYVADSRRPPLVAGRQLRLGLLWPHSLDSARLARSLPGLITQGALEAWGARPADLKLAQVERSEPTRAHWQSVTAGAEVTVLGESWSTAPRFPPLRVVKEGHFDGLLTVGIIEERWLDELLSLGIPTVIVDFPNERFAHRADQVFVDAVPAYRSAVRHFASLGCKRIHFIGANIGPPAPDEQMSIAEYQRYSKRLRRPDPDSFQRESAYRQGMAECGLPVFEDWIHFAGFRTEDSDVLKQRLLAIPDAERPEAVVCHAHGHANFAAQVFAERGIRVLAAGATFDDAAGPALPIVADGLDLGRTAADLLVWRLQKQGRRLLRVGVPMSFAGNVRVPATDKPLLEGVER